MSGIHGHQAGSRRYGKIGPHSDWDWVLEDNAETRAFLKSSGYKQTADFSFVAEGIMTSHWRHTHYAAEVYLTKSEQQSRVASMLIWGFRFNRIFTSKYHRRKVWWALEKCCAELHGLWVHYKAERQVRMNEEYRLRDTPLKR